MIYFPNLNTWSNGAVYFGNQDEASWVKLPDDSILTVDRDTTNSERYIPALRQWIRDANVPVPLFSSGYADDIYNSEIGAAILLSDGRAFFLGGTGKTAFYTPSGNTNQGTWAPGPDIPNGRVAQDAPAAMMVNGKILCLVTAAGTRSPVYFYEFNPFANTFTPLSSPTDPTTPGSSDNAGISDWMHMLALPDGNILFTDHSDAPSQLYIFQPDGVPLPAGKPTISSISQNADGSYHLTGTKLNGISEGAAFGDDAQSDSNYPLVRMTNLVSGNVYYARTFNWSSTGVMTGSTPVSTEFVVTGNVPAGNYSLVVVANGNPSAPVSFSWNPLWVDFNYVGGTQNGSYTFPFKTLAQGTAAVTAGGDIWIKTAGSSPETMTITKPMTIRAYAGPATIGH